MAQQARDRGMQVLDDLVEDATCRGPAAVGVVGLGAPVPERDRPDRAADGRAGGRPRQALPGGPRGRRAARPRHKHTPAPQGAAAHDQAGRRARQGPHDPREPAAGRVGGPQVPRSRGRPALADPGGQPRAHPRGREVRPHQGLQVLDLRNLVDPPGAAARPGQHRPHRAAARSRPRADGQGPYAEFALLQQLGREPPEKEIADELGLPVERLREVKLAAQDVASLDKPIGEDGDATHGRTGRRRGGDGSGGRRQRRSSPSGRWSAHWTR